MFRLCWRVAEALSRLWARLCGLAQAAAVALGAAGPDRPARPVRLWQSFALILPIALVIAILLPALHLVMSPSIPAWIVRAAPGPIAKNDYVMFMLRDPVAGSEPVSVTKRALCMPGERLTTIETRAHAAPRLRNGHYFCDGIALGVSMPFGPHGRRLDHLRWSGIIPPDQVYVGSPHPRGYDSRYFGLVPIATLTRMERLL
jgi:type IV secretory pathway protease TraF